MTHYWSGLRVDMFSLSSKPLSHAFSLLFCIIWRVNLIININSQTIWCPTVYNVTLIWFFKIGDLTYLYKDMPVTKQISHSWPSFLLDEKGMALYYVYHIWRHSTLSLYGVIHEVLVMAITLWWILKIKCKIEELSSLNSKVNQL